MDYEIDLRKYFSAVARRWRLIVICAALASAIVFALLWTRPLVYEATASVLTLVRQTGSQLGTNEPLLAIETIDANARRVSLIALAQSESIERALPEETVAQVAPPDYKPGMLLQLDRLQFEPQGDLLNISATADTPERAKALADAWAQTYVSTVEPLFTDGHSEVRVASLSVLPFEPASRGIVRNTALAGILGAALGIVISLALELTRRPAPMPRRAESERAVREPSPSR